MKIVYICHPISGDIEGNLKSIRNIVRYINISYPDVIPFVPYYADIVSMDELWVFGDRVSCGMQGEIDLAKEAGIIIKQAWIVPDPRLEIPVESLMLKEWI